MGRDTDPIARQRLAELYTRFQVLSYLGFRVRTAVSHGASARSGELGHEAHGLGALRDTAAT